MLTSTVLGHRDIRIKGVLTINKVDPICLGQMLTHATKKKIEGGAPLVSGGKGGQREFL